MTELIVYDDLCLESSDTSYGNLEKIIRFKVYLDWNTIGEAQVYQIKDGIYNPYSLELQFPTVKYLLYNLTVDPKYRGQGHGKALLQKILETIKEPIILHTINSQPTNFYWLQGANLIDDTEGLLEGCCWMIFNLDETTKNLITDEYVLHFNKIPRILKNNNIYNPEWSDEEDN